jgi:hypothetical protein
LRLDWLDRKRDLFNRPVGQARGLSAAKLGRNRRLNTIRERLRAARAAAAKSIFNVLAEIAMGLPHIL